MHGRIRSVWISLSGSTSQDRKPSFHLQPEKAKFTDSGLSRSETHDAVHGSFIKSMKLPNVETLIVLVPGSNHFMFDVVLVMK